MYHNNNKKFYVTGKPKFEYFDICMEEYEDILADPPKEKAAPVVVNLDDDSSVDHSVH